MGATPARRRREVNADMDDAEKLVMFLIAIYGDYKSARTALRLGGELFG